MPIAIAPSLCPGSTEIMPPRTDSAIYAPVLMETTRIATAHLFVNCTAFPEKYGSP